jgi:hypothetical protein
MEHEQNYLLAGRVYGARTADFGIRHEDAIELRIMTFKDKPAFENIFELKTS